jgi:hypothetical protein
LEDYNVSARVGLLGLVLGTYLHELEVHLVPLPIYLDLPSVVVTDGARAEVVGLEDSGLDELPVFL